MKKVILIPARYSSSRLPGKPLQDICGKPMVVRVCESIDQAVFDMVVVATDDHRIFDVVVEAGYRSIMTKDGHVSGTDRLQEAAAKLDLLDDDIIINLQGDEPLMPCKNLVQVANLLVNNPSASISTLYEETPAAIALKNSNMVKLVQAVSGRVLYFSRAGIPFDRDGDRSNDAVVKRHVGLYAYRKSALDKFVQYNEGALERLEKLEQLRFMENGDVIVAEKASLPIPVGVDTIEDLETVRKIFRENLA